MSNKNIDSDTVPKPEEDGVTHIRLSPKGNTELGRLLHFGTERPIDDPEYGKFSSIAAFWHWYTNGRSHALRDIHHSNMIRSSMYGSKYYPGAEEETMEVLKRSILNDPRLAKLVKDTTIPFISYDVVDFEKGGEIVYVSTNIGWYDTTINNLRDG